MSAKPEVTASSVGVETDEERKDAKALEHSILFDFEIEKDKTQRSDNPKGRKKKPPGYPIRPRSAYNFFFADQKEHVNAERQRRKDEGTLDPREDAFFAMGKTIGSRWKALAEKDKEPFMKLAKEDQLRYKKAVELFNERAERQKKDDSETDPKSTTAQVGELAKRASRQEDDSHRNEKKQKTGSKNQSSLDSSSKAIARATAESDGRASTSLPPPSPPPLPRASSSGQKDGARKTDDPRLQHDPRVLSSHPLFAAATTSQDRRSVAAALDVSGAFPSGIAAAAPSLADTLFPPLPHHLSHLYPPGALGAIPPPVHHGTLSSLHALSVQQSADRLLLARAAAASTSHPFASSLGAHLPYHHHHLSPALPGAAAAHPALALGGAGFPSVASALQQQEAQNRAILEALVQQQVANDLSERALKELLKKKRESEGKSD